MAAPKHAVKLMLPSGEQRTIEVGADEFILLDAFGAGLDLPYMCLQGWCLTCAGRAREGAWDQSGSRRYFESDREQGFILLCTAKPRSDLIIETHQQEQMRDHRIRHSLPTPRSLLRRE